jgi:hypothetical protein
MSRSLIGLLVATVAVFAVVLVAFKPGGSSTTGGPSLGQLQSAVNAAKASAAAQNRAAAAAGNTVAAAGSKAATAAKPASAAKSATAAKPATAAKSATAATTATVSKTAAKPATASRTHTAVPAAVPHTATPSQRLNVVDKALSAHKVLALLFYNPAAPDDRAVKQELTTIPTSGGRVVKLAVPINEVANYPVVTNQVPIQSSPTLVIIDKSAQAFTLVGFADSFEIAHRVGDALSMH